MEDKLPFNPSHFSIKTESVGTTVHLPKDKDSLVVKVSKRDQVSTSLIKALSEIKELRKREGVAMKVASLRTREAIVPQEYVLAQGSKSTTTRAIRTQKYVEGVPLKKLGFLGIMELNTENIKTLKSILKDSMRCFLTYGTNYDLFGSDERDAQLKKRTLNIKRLIFPLRNSSNLVLTQDGIKLIDPNVLSTPNRNSPKSLALQTILFTSSVINYALLDINERIRKIAPKEEV